MIKIRAYVFSYNRCDFLKNCVESLLRNTKDCELVIIDDCSEDPETVRYLDAISTQYRVLYSTKNQTCHINGGLHENMMMAFNDAKIDSVEYVFFVQDDMQVTRELSTRDFDNFEMFFSKNKKSMQLSLSFFKSHKRQEVMRNIYLDDSGYAYFKTDGCPGTKSFSDTGVFKVDRFFNLYGHILKGEDENEKSAREKGLRMGVYVFPVVMWLPLPVAYRLKNKSLPLLLFEKLGNAGFYPYCDFNNSDLQSLLSRDLESAPFAEEYLVCPGLPSLKVWTYGGGESLLYAYGGWRRALARTYSFLNKLII